MIKRIAEDAKTPTLRRKTALFCCFLNSAVVFTCRQGKRQHFMHRYPQNSCSVFSATSLSWISYNVLLFSRYTSICNCLLMNKDEDRGSHSSSLFEKCNFYVVPQAFDHV